MNPSYNGSSSGPLAGGAGPVISSGAGSSDAGDLVLSSDKGRSKKWILVLVAVFVLVAAIVAGALLMLDQQSEKKISAYVNEYLSLMATGEKNEIFENEKLDFSDISNDEQKNIYTVARLYNSTEDENVSYYNGLQELLNEIKNKVNTEQYNEDKKNELIFLVDDSKEMLSYYFVAAALAYTNSDYEYYFKDKTLNGFLSVYGYPFDDTDSAMMLDYKYIIDGLYEQKKNYYDGIAKTSCTSDEGIDYECLATLNSTELAESKKRIAQFTNATEGQADQMLNLLITNANSISEIINGNKLNG